MKTKRTVQKILSILCVLILLILCLVGCDCKHSAESELVGSRSYLHMTEEKRKCSRCGEQFELFYLDLQLDNIVSIKLVSPDGTLLLDIDSDEELNEFVSFFGVYGYDKILESRMDSSQSADQDPNYFDKFEPWHNEAQSSNRIEILYSNDECMQIYLFSSKKTVFFYVMDVFVCQTDTRHPYWNY